MNNARALQVLVTRPDPAGSELCETIRQAGYAAIHFPTLTFASPSNQIAYQDALKQIGYQDWLIFLSPRSVYMSMPDIRREWPDMPPQIQFAAVGAGTAKALLAAGIHAEHPMNEWSSEGLLAMAPFQSVVGQHIALVRGEGGRDILADAFAARGANVLEVMAYRREVPKVDASIYLDLFKQDKIDIIICTSFEGVRNLKELLGANLWPTLQTLPLIVVSERIQQLAHELGFQTIWVAKNASHEALLQTLAQYKDEYVRTHK